MRFVPCPDCGFDKHLGAIDEGTRRLVQCESCSREFIVSVRDGELSTEMFLHDEVQESDEYVRSLNEEFEGY
ncbi:MAG: hypothetical protein ABH829_00790 [archaeon]